MNRVLVVSPHPDDEAVGPGGTLAGHVAAGDAVHVVFLTSGEAGGHGRPPEETRRVREAEAGAAARVLGIAAWEFWREPDGALAVSDALVARLRARIVALDPATIYVTHPDEQHPDHAVAGHLVIDAVRDLPAPSVLGFEVWTPIRRMHHIVDITAHLERKLAAVRAHASQEAVLPFAAAFEGLARYRGEMHSWPGGPYAEVFVDLRRDDPMIHHVFANRSNAGDWLSARGIQRLLGAPATQEHLCDEPFVPETLAALAAAPAGDLVIIGGGGLFMDYFRPFWEGYTPLAPRFRTCIWGVGVVDLKAEPSLLAPDVVRPVVAGAAVVAVRDELTRAFLGIPGLPPPVLCPSIAAVQPAPADGEGVLHVANLTTVGRTAYLRMRRVGRAVARATGRPFRETNNRFEDEQRGLERTLRLYAMSDLVLSSRLHGCLIALAMGRPVVAVSGDRKLEALMEAVGLGAWLFDASDLAGVRDALLRAPTDQPSVEGRLSEERAANADIAARVRAIVAGATA